MGDYSFISNRVLKNKDGQDSGNIAVRVKVGSTVAEGFYICPECKHKGQINQGWGRPFSVKCEACQVLMKLPKLKDEIKKEKQAEKKARRI